MAITWLLAKCHKRFPMPLILSAAFGRGFHDIRAVIGKRSRWMGQRSRRSSMKKALLGDALVPTDESPATANNPRHVVVVMDGMKGFTMAPLEWALENLIGDNCTLTLLGVMPWLNIPLSSKIWLDVWPVEIDNLSSLQERNEWRSDVRYLKLQAIIDLCRRYGVVPQKEVAMGYPTKLLVVEKITSLHASWVVFDKHQRKNREFYAERIPCNMVMMNENGEGDMIKGRCAFNSIGRLSTTGESPGSSSLAPTPQVLISEQLREILREKVKEKEAVSISAS